MRIPRCLFVLAIAAACGGDKDPHDDHDGHDHEHAHRHGPHDGEVIDVPGGLACLEIVHDAKTGDLTVYVLAPDLKTPLEIDAPVLNLAKGPVQLTLTAVAPGADGRASSFRATHDGLKEDPIDGRLRVKVADKTHQLSLEGHHH
jgi:hypothetical protein